MSGGTPAPVPPVPGGVPAPPAPGGFPLGGAAAAAGLTFVVAGIKKPGKITTTFDTVSKKAAPRNDEGCTECRPDPRRAKVEVYESQNIVYRFLAIRIPLFVEWEINGCDVVGATFVLGESVARFGWEGEVTGEAKETTRTGSSLCQDCCERCACVKLKYSIDVTAPLGIPGARTRQGFVTVCGNGLFLHDPVE